MRQTIPARYRYVVIEGPIGAGKTSLARKLAELGGHQIRLEDPAGNPFLERFYRDSARFALPAQLAFLLERVEEMRDIAQQEIGGASLIADFLPEKDALFARLTLADDELALYRALSAHISMPRRTPDLVIYLQASPEALFSRIQKRAIPMELQISDAYLRALCEIYSEFFYHYAAAPVLTIDTEHLNPAENAHDFDLLLERIEHMRGRKEVFVKGTR